MRGFIRSKLVTVSTSKLTAISIAISIVITTILTGVLSILLLGRLSTELLLVNAVIGTIVPALVAPFALSLLKGEQINQELERENMERKRLEEGARQQAKDMQAISELAIEFAAAATEANSYKLIAEKVREITNALAVGITLYDPTARVLATKYIAISGQMLDTANRLIGHNLVGMVNHVTPEMERRMLEGRVESFEDLSEVSFGAVPKPVATLIKKTLGVGKFTGMALTHRDSLIGTAIIAQREGEPDLNIDVCNTLADFSAVALQRKITETELRESETKFRTLIENLSDGILLVDEQGSVIEWNPSQQMLIGLKREDVIGKPIWDVQFQFMEKSNQTPEYYERLKEQSQQILISGKFDKFNRPSEGTIQATNGVVRNILQTAFPIQTDRGVRVGAIMRDISAQKRVEADRERLIAELKAKNTELEQFTYTVSHDLKAPLITIKGFLGLLEKDALDGQLERMKKDVTRITDATEKMHRLLNELLELSRIGRIVNPSREAAFEKIVRDAIKSVHGRLDERGIRVNVAEELPIVYVDQIRVTQVVQNLLDNSAKFMGDQTDPVITVGAKGIDTDGKPILFVQDNGIGIDARHFDSVFGLFHKLDIGVDGTGIGLALVKRIIDIHGGRIWLTSEGIGKGTTVWFTLPVP